MYKFKIILHSGLIGLLGYLFIGLFLSRAAGQTMSNQDYIIQTEKVDSAPNSATANSQSVPPDQSDQRGINFKVQTGFANAQNTTPFSVSLSSDMVDFGELSPTNPIIRTIDLSINNPPPFGYSVVAFANHPLQNIPDTTCDNGQCDEANAAEWSNALTYGFGYRCDNLIGNVCGSSFSNPNFYKHFANASASQSPQSVISGITPGSNNVRLSYKINIPPTIEKGLYNNIVTYIAIPSF